MTPAALTDQELDRVLGAYRVPAMSAGFADRVVAEAQRPHRRVAPPAPRRAARRPWIRRRLIAGVVLLNLIAASAIAAAFGGHGLALTKLGDLSHHLFAPRHHVERVAQVTRPTPAPAIRPHPAPSAPPPQRTALPPAPVMASLPMRTPGPMLRALRDHPHLAARVALTHPRLARRWAATHPVAMRHWAMRHPLMAQRFLATHPRIAERLAETRPQRVAARQARAARQAALRPEWAARLAVRQPSPVPHAPVATEERARPDRPAEAIRRDAVDRRDMALPPPAAARPIADDERAQQPRFDRPNAAARAERQRLRAERRLARASRPRLGGIGRRRG